MLIHTHEAERAVLLIGFESSGKSALFRGLTGHETGEESNFRGSTVMTRKGMWASSSFELVDVPGIRMKDDSETTREAINAIYDADIVALVVRATHVKVELPLLLEEVNLTNKKVFLILTFADKTRIGLSELASYYEDWLGIPVSVVNARSLQDLDKTKLQQAAASAKAIRRKAMRLLPMHPVIQPQTTVLEHPLWGRPFSLIGVVLLFALPVLLAYLLSAWLQPVIDRNVIEPVKALLANSPPPLQTLLIGDYGIVTLGWYSFLWAFPVVIFLGISTALTEESGIKDRITDSLDGWMRKVGLNGRDLLPILTGFGCNVVAVFQSRACSACTRKSCVTMITFGSACSYQIGASLSIFSSAGYPLLFLPYIFALGIVGVIHNRIWNRKSTLQPSEYYLSKTFLQKPQWRAVSWRVHTVVKQFILQAMPIFLLICFIATVLQMAGWMNGLSKLAAPAMQWLHFPEEAASAIIFSILRKDGLLVLNHSEGALLDAMSAGQLFVLVYLASTLTACLVTLWTVRKEFGFTFAFSLAGKQMVTSMVSSIIIMLLVGWQH
ncbi:nucleoside recognition domain-containing protein [Paenibacillus sp. MMO-58]|uniref:nucleoside recognition domain-containing protein n=1 Tax=Paenibacillus sp. MMO-58 TaxID=3081290 RepID=UPI00301AEFB6